MAQFIPDGALGFPVALKLPENPASWELMHPNPKVKSTGMEVINIALISAR
ncbi:MAG: hypothetical protein WD431_15625 [Cyclobacteriaceae bacterium]